VFDQNGDILVTLIAINDHNCSDTTSQVIRILNPMIFYVPNTFTPDNSDLNDVFLPIMTSGFDYWLYDLTVFNRWGEVVFQSKHPKKGWDGTYSGSPAPEGTYIWQITVQNAELINEIHRGHVNLLR
jgi:gliding motility-associated-like protein